MPIDSKWHLFSDIRLVYLMMFTMWVMRPNGKVDGKEEVYE